MCDKTHLHKLYMVRLGKGCLVHLDSANNGSVNLSK